MEIQEAFGRVFATARKSKGLTQEEFEPISPRTYISHLERGQSSPTIIKLNELAAVMGVHPVSLLFHTYLQFDKKMDALQLMAKILEDSKSMNIVEN